MSILGSFPNGLGANRHQPSAKTSAASAPASDVPPASGEGRGQLLPRWRRIANVLISPAGVAVGCFAAEHAASIDSLLAAANRPVANLDLSRVAIARDQAREALDLLGVALDLRAAGRHVPDVQFGCVQDALVEAVGALGKVVGS